MRKLLLVFLFFFAACSHAGPTVILLRHGEKATDDPKDPSLSESGKARAGALAALLKHAGVTHIFATEYRRTQATVAPLADSLRLNVEIVSSKEPEKQVELLRALPEGSVAVVAGHSNTIPKLAKALGAEIADTELVEGETRLFDTEFDRLFLLSGGSKPKLIELRYTTCVSP